MTPTYALELFQLDDHPDDTQVKTTYREIAVVLHPDRHNGKRIANELLRQYTEARDLLLCTPVKLRCRANTTTESSTNATSGASRRARSSTQTLADFAVWIGREAGKGNRAAQVVVGGTVAVALGALLAKMLDNDEE